MELIPDTVNKTKNLKLGRSWALGKNPLLFFSLMNIAVK